MSSRRILVDTNVLVYSTFEDSDRHEEALRILSEEKVVIPRVVIHEFIWVLAKLTNDAELIKRKVEELKDFEVIAEELDDIVDGVKTLSDDGRTLRMINDYVILALAKRLNLELATYGPRVKKGGDKTRN